MSPATCRRRADRSEGEGLSSSLSSSVSHDGTERPVVGSTFDSQVSSVQETQRHSSESEQIRTLLDRQSEQILADCQAENTKTRIPGRLRWKKYSKNEWNDRVTKKKFRAHQGYEQHRRDQQLLHEQLLKQNRDLREAQMKSLNEMEELKRFQCSTFDTIVSRKLVEDQDIILELTGKMQELQNEVNCMNDSRDFQDADQNTVDIPTLPVNLCFSHLIQFLVEC